ncbi:MAG: hypothetical protein HZA54_02020 [Planctomycetes bacterium]|nr:hypothetical protein [Planctomycetota bacterium]
MARKTASLVLVFALLSFLPGCLIGGPGKDPGGMAKVPPKEVWARYGELLRNNDYAKSYHLLSSDSKIRYPYMDYYLMYTQTRFGALIRHLFVAWTITDVSYSADGKRAIVIFTHDIFSEYKKRFDMALEKEEWKIRITLSGCLDMPEWDERILFPETFGDVDREPVAEGGAEPVRERTPREELHERRRGR